MQHELKILPEFFEAWTRGEKRWELRLNDRDYHAGDDLHLREFGLLGTDASSRGVISYSPGYTGRSITVHVVSVLFKHEGLAPGYCLMSCEEVKASVDT